MLKSIRAQNITLQGIGANAGDVSIILNPFSFKDGTTLSMSMFGDKGFCTLDQGDINEEEISFTGISVDSSLMITLSGILSYSPYYTPSTFPSVSGLKYSHQGNVSVVFSNGPAGNFASINEIDNDLLSSNNAWTGTNSFNSHLPSSTQTPVNSTDLTTKQYVDDTAIAGAPNASTTVKGISKLSVTPASSTNPIAVGDNDPRMLSTAIANSLNRSYTTGEAISIGDPIYLDPVSDLVYKAIFNSTEPQTYISTGFLGFSTANITSGNVITSGQIQSNGIVTGLSGLTGGQQTYLPYYNNTNLTGGFSVTSYTSGVGNLPVYVGGILNTGASVGNPLTLSGITNPFGYLNSTGNLVTGTLSIYNVSAGLPSGSPIYTSSSQSMATTIFPITGITTTSSQLAFIFNTTAVSGTPNIYTGVLSNSGFSVGGNLVSIIKSNDGVSWLNSDTQNLSNGTFRLYYKTYNPISNTGFGSPIGISQSSSTVLLYDKSFGLSSGTPYIEASTNTYLDSGVLSIDMNNSTGNFFNYYSKKILTSGTLTITVTATNSSTYPNSNSGVVIATQHALGTWNTVQSSLASGSTGDITATSNTITVNAGDVVAVGMASGQSYLKNVKFNFSPKVSSTFLI